MQTAAHTVPLSNAAVWTGRVISGLLIVFLLADGAMKLVPLDVVLQTHEQLAIPGHLARTLGVLTIVCTLLYAIPRTAVLGAILLTGYLGGAMAIPDRRASRPPERQTQVRRLLDPPRSRLEQHDGAQGRCGQ